MPGAFPVQPREPPLLCGDWPGGRQERLPERNNLRAGLGQTVCAHQHQWWL